MRLATIDLGTNTVRLLVADVGAPSGWTPVHQEQRVTRLGEGAASTGVLAEPAMTRTAATVAEYVGRARGLDARQIRVVGTSALREASNARAFIDAVERETGIVVDVLSGDDEARLTVRGVLGALPAWRGARGQTAVVFDIGGGSTEYTVVRDGAVVATVSLRLGVVPLAERFAFPGRVPAAAYREMAEGIATRLAAELPSPIREASPGELVGTAGTVTTLAALDLGLTTYDAARVHGHRLTLPAVERLRLHLAGLSLDERAALPCLEPGRADLIVPGVAIVQASMTLLGVASLIVSDAGLREGVMLEAAERAD
jgi:exopolyphosphatase/guanosine-5'-triphosphate,3'-diphosphate pyrophosphatase